MDDLNRNTAILKAFHRIGKVNISYAMGMPPGEFYVLEIIEKYAKEHPEKEGIYVSEIAKMAHMASSQVSRMLKGLEERELIRRSVDAKDRRNTYVFLTENGKITRESTHRRMEAYAGRVAEGMGAEQLDVLVRLCNRMADVMEQELERKEE